MLPLLQALPLGEVTRTSREREAVMTVMIAVVERCTASWFRQRPRVFKEVLFRVFDRLADSNAGEEEVLMGCRLGALVRSEGDRGLWMFIGACV